MPLALSVELVDALGQPAVGGGSWQASVQNEGKQVGSVALTQFTGATLSAPIASVTNWARTTVTITPSRYTPVTVTIGPSGKDVYRDDPLTEIVAVGATALTVRIPLLRIRESKGVLQGGVPASGTNLSGPWLLREGQPPRAVYGDLPPSRVPLLPTVNRVTSVFDGKYGVLGDADDAGWGRFGHLTRSGVEPAKLGAPLLVEYGETGVMAQGPVFLVALWAPVVPGGARPAWRDLVCFFHPSTTRTGFFPVAYPYRGAYPYQVGPNPGVQGALCQPYVELGLRYLVQNWAAYHPVGNESVVVMPIMPGPKATPPGQQRSEDELDYGRPFRSRTGMWRLLAEVNLHLHRSGYRAVSNALDEWWGSRPPLIPPRSTPTDARPPVIRRIAVVGYSQSAVLLSTMLANEPQGRRYDAPFWGVPAPAIDTFAKAWTEAWALDALTSAATVPSAAFEKQLLSWLGDKPDRRFLLGASGTTTVPDLPGRFPALAAAAARKVRVPSIAHPARVGDSWQGANDRWFAFHATNGYLSGDAVDTANTPRYPFAPSDDDAHAFMFHLSSGLAFGWTTVGVP